MLTNLYLLWFGLPYALCNLREKLRYVFVDFVENLRSRNAPDKVVCRSFINLYKTKIIQCLEFWFFYSFHLFIFFLSFSKVVEKKASAILCRLEKGIIEIASAISTCRRELQRLSVPLHLNFNLLSNCRDSYLHSI